MGALLNSWNGQLASAIERELELVEKAEKIKSRSKVETERCEYGIFLRALDPERLAATTILSAMGMFGRTGMSNALKTTALVVGIGKEVQDEIFAENAIKIAATDFKDTRLRLNALKKLLSERKLRSQVYRWNKVVDEVCRKEEMLPWPTVISAKVGAVLLSLLCDVAKFPVETRDPETKEVALTWQPAFNHSYNIHWGRRLGIIHLNMEMVKLVAREPPTDILGRHLPMLCEPRPWTGYKEGAFELSNTSIMRSTPGEELQQLYVKSSLEKNGLEKIRRGLDVLGKTPWVINKDVLRVMLEAWNSGEPIANLSPAEPDLPDPERPKPDDGIEALKEWARDMRTVENERTSIHSNRCFQNFQMEVARAFRNETFYLPHNLDFRGRAYPLSPYLNQMSADNCRGLLLFGEAKPLGNRGLMWLKVQLASLYGFDKASFAEREQFVMDNLDNVLDSASNGLHGRRWWLKGEEPWQCLAACIELKNALLHPDPTQYCSRLPIHQDGSCNGLQHYAALGGDMMGAQQVNLEPSHRPSDVYTGVSEFVEREISREAALGNPIAKLLEGKVTRKIVKQTVMTNVYGVTFHGALRQVLKQLESHYPDELRKRHWACAGYIAGKVFWALGSMFAGAHDIQYWLGDCASRISQSLSPEQIVKIAKDALRPASDESKLKCGDVRSHFRSTVIWTTPLGLPVVQPYRSRKSRRIFTTLQDVSVIEPTLDAPIAKRKQLQAFPPNFIHSLDATHMLLSAVACNEAGLSFSAVHDSFWTHACDVDEMSHILREAFVDIHSDDVVGRLAAEFQVRYGNNIFLANIRRDSPMAKEIRKLRTGPGNKGRLHELIDEYRRIEFLRSDDPEVQAQGRAMKTPGSVFEENGGTHDDLAISSSLGETAIHHIPEDEESMVAHGIDPADPYSHLMESSSSEIDDGGHQKVDGNTKNEKEDPRRGLVWIWLPMSFRPVPRKGDWDVSRIRESPYFFS